MRGNIACFVVLSATTRESLFFRSWNCDRLDQHAAVKALRSRGLSSIPELGGDPVVFSVISGATVVSQRHGDVVFSAVGPAGGCNEFVVQETLLALSKMCVELCGGEKKFSAAELSASRGKLFVCVDEMVTSGGLARADADTAMRSAKLKPIK